MAKFIVYAVFAASLLFLYVVLIAGGIYLPSHTSSPTTWQGTFFLMFVVFVGTGVFAAALSRDIKNFFKNKSNDETESFNRFE